MSDSDCDPEDVDDDADGANQVVDGEPAAGTKERDPVPPFSPIATQFYHSAKPGSKAWVWCNGMVRVVNHGSLNPVVHGWVHPFFTCRGLVPWVGASPFHKPWFGSVGGSIAPRNHEPWFGTTLHIAQKPPPSRRPPGSQ